MKIERKSMSKYSGSCNFCDKGKLSKGGRSLIYPYNRFTEITGKFVQMRICDECLDTIVKKVTTST